MATNDLNKGLDSIGNKSVKSSLGQPLGQSDGAGPILKTSNSPKKKNESKTSNKNGRKSSLSRSKVSALSGKDKKMDSPMRDLERMNSPSKGELNGSIMSSPKNINEKSHSQYQNGGPPVTLLKKGNNH